DLDQRGVGLNESLVECREQRRELADLLVLEPQRKSDFARLETRNPEQRIDLLGENFFGRLAGDFLDIHAALGARDHGDGPRLPIDQHPEIELASHLARLLYIDTAYDAAFGPRLMRHQRLAEQLGREVAHII